MTHSFDLYYTLGLFALAGVVALAYSLRVLLKGRAKNDRIDKAGGSALLSKNVMEGTYWFLTPIGKALVFCGVSANQVSWASLFFAVLTGLCLAYGHFGFGAGFAMISALLDSLDGYVARATGSSSDAGEVLDTTVDRYAEFLFISGLILYYREIPALVVLALFALVGSFMVSYSTAKAEALHVEPPKGSMRRPERAMYLILGAALSPITIPWLEEVRMFPVPIGHPMVVALGLVAVLSNLSAIERLYAVAKSVRERDSELHAVRKRVAETQLEESAHEPLEIR